MYRPILRQTVSPTRYRFIPVVFDAWQIPSVASSSRSIASIVPNRLGKGKQRETTFPDGLESVSLEVFRGLSRRPRIIDHRRHFHPSRPRYAVPLIPATAAILKVSDGRARADLSLHRY